LAEPTPIGKARPVSRFGTPLPPDTGQEKAVAAVPAGTPVLGTSPGAAAASTPTPPLETKPQDASAARERVAPWVGTIKGELEEHWFYSGALDREMPYWAYLPPDYGTAKRRYPVLYMLHGRGGHRDEWINYTLVEVADREMSYGILAPMIIIMPQGDRGFWVNNVGDGPRWGDYVTQDLVAQVDATFRTLRAPTARAIGGLSMGGFGGLTLAFTHPEVFGVVGAHAPSLRDAGEDIAFLGSGDEFAQRDPVTIAATAPGMRRLRVWLDIDQADPWLARAETLHEMLTARQVDHIWQVLPGIHNYEYWSTHVIDYLRFYGDALARQ
jgi:enterochelin esterase-like enzyme